MTKTFMLGAAIAAATTISCATSGAAGTIDFNSKTNLPQKGALTFSNGLHSVQVTARKVREDGKLKGPALISSYEGSKGGLGICTGRLDRAASGGCAGDDHTVSGSDGADEMALINFGETAVRLTSVTLSLVGNDDDFDVAVYGRGSKHPVSFTDDIALPNINPIVEATFGSEFRTVTYLFEDLLVGSIFGFGADGPDDDFKIQSIGFESLEVASVPLPAAGWMLIAGLGALAASRRKKSA